MDDDSLRYLLAGGHYDMEQRRRRGIWPHPHLQLDDCVRCLVGVFERERWFPFEPKARSQDDAVYEGVLVERQEHGRHVCHFQRAHPLAPSQIAEQGHQCFDNAEDAARF